MSGEKRTKYELKQEKRMAAAEEEKKSWKRFKIGFGIAAAAVIAAVLVSIGLSAYDNYAALNKPYITVGEHEITEVEFDYYFYNSVNSYLDTYGDYVAMFGLDVTSPLDQQAYSEELTWKDYFDESAVIEITRVKSMVDDAKANGFTYDDTDDIKNIESELASMAEAEGMTTTSYYMKSYGKNATAERIRPFFKENVLAAAYQTYLIQQNQPTEEEVEAKYAENKMAYDLVDCRKFYVDADVAEDASEDEIEAAMKAAKATADEFAGRREKGEDFKSLCVEYASEEEKANYDGEKDGSLIDDGAFYVLPSVALNWLYAEERAEGDITVLEETGNKRYCIVEYLDRTNDWDTTKATVANSLATQVVNEYKDTLYDQYEVKEGRGKLMYLTLPDPELETGAE